MGGAPLARRCFVNPPLVNGLKRAAADIRIDLIVVIEIAIDMMLSVDITILRHRLTNELGVTINSVTVRDSLQTMLIVLLLRMLRLWLLTMVAAASETSRPCTTAAS